MLHGRELLEYRMIQDRVRAMLAERDGDRAVRSHRAAAGGERPPRNAARTGVVPALAAFLSAIAMRGGRREAGTAARPEQPAATGGAGNAAGPVPCVRRAATIR